MVDIPAVTSTKVFLVFFEDTALLGVDMLAAALSWRPQTSLPETLVSWDPSDWDSLLSSSSTSAEKEESFSSLLSFFYEKLNREQA